MRDESSPQAQPAAAVAPTAPARPRPASVRDYAYYRQAFAGRAMPFAWLDLDALDENIRAIIGRAESKHIRVASKSVRSVAVLRRILAASPVFRGLMCFTAREAAWLAGQGFDDLLIGYPAWHADDLVAVAQATAAGAHITLMVDSVAHVEQVEAAAQQYHVRLPLCLEVDMTLAIPGLHFGVWRSPLRDADLARPVLERIACSQDVFLDGIMGYEAQVAGVGDNYPGQMAKNALVRALKGRSVRLDAERRAAVVALAQSLCGPLRFVNGGGTGSMATTRQESAVTEITVGSGFYSPALFDNYREFRYQPAAGYAIEIVRVPAPGVYTCLGGGYSASGGGGKDRLPSVYLPGGARLDPLEGAGEVQTPIHYRGPERLAPGDPILMRHAKAGELCERFTHLVCVQNGAVVDELTTYRGDGQCFL
ncbi:MAG TPA: amino acid deaminase/aldolase [Ktedonobacterales bacterium]|nr:amino acid deaminase/aldolase [Ktedonobacterales bacterium]